MSFQTLVLEKLAQLTSLVNSIQSNSKKIEELPAQTILDLSSKVAVSRAGTTEQIDLQLLATSLQNNTYNRIVSIDGDISVSGNNVTVPPITVEFENSIYTKATNTILSVPFAATGSTRIDIIVYDTVANDVVLVSGNETEGLAVRPPIPANSILITQINVTDSELGEPDDPLIGEAFVKKSFAQTSVDSITTGADASVPIPANGSSCIRLGNASLTSVACLNLSAIIGNSNAEVPYPGKIFEIMNGTGSDVEIKHATGADIQFNTKDGNSIVIPNNESLFVKYDPDGLLELFRSWSTSLDSNYSKLISNIAISSGNTNWWNIGNAANGASGLPFINTGTTDLLTSVTNNTVPHFKALGNCKLKSVSIDFCNAGGGKYYMGIVKGKFVNNTAFYSSSIADKTIIFEGVIFNDVSTGYQKGYFDIIKDDVFVNNTLEEGDCIFICLHNTYVQNGAAGKNTIITVGVDNL